MSFYAKVEKWEGDEVFLEKTRAEQQAAEAISRAYEEEREQRRQEALAAVKEPLLELLPVVQVNTFRRDDLMYVFECDEELQIQAQRAAELCLARRGELCRLLAWEIQETEDLENYPNDTMLALGGFGNLPKTTQTARIDCAKRQLGLGEGAAVTVCSHAFGATHSSTDWWVDHKFNAVLCQLRHTQKFVAGGSLVGLPDAFRTFVVAWISSIQGQLPAAIRDEVISAVWLANGYMQGCHVMFFAHTMKKDMS